jgi:glycosyltransferase involved in cell wall biosynthesis
LKTSAVAPLECIVVDDGSSDDSVRIAAQQGARVRSTGGRFGPARARNIGVKAASGEIVLFLDADVCVYPDTISKIVAEFAGDPELDAVIGSYDRSPSATNFMSQYRNLMHSYVHQHSNREATTFWSGCGAIRRQVFLDFGGFDENHYQTPAIEDIELGYRLFQAKRKLALNANIQVKHLKSWSLSKVIETDFFYRAIPWSELILRSGRMPNDLNLRISQRISVALAFILAALGAYGGIRWHAYLLTPLLAVFFILLFSCWSDTSHDQSRATVIMVYAVMALIVGLSYRFHMYPIIPLVLVAWLAVFTRHRYAYAREKRRRWTTMVAGGCCLLVMAWMAVYLPAHPLKFAFFVLLMTLVALNKQFYLFLAGEKGRMFALAAIPFHLLYFVYSGVAFMVALIHYGFDRLRHPSAGLREVVVPDGPEKTKTIAP